jgi:hypothetical protein
VKWRYRGLRKRKNREAESEKKFYELETSMPIY